MTDTRPESRKKYDFRNISDNVLFGTASDRYGGWIGQIYSPSWEERVQKRRKQLGKKTYTESVVPVEAVKEYFEHFSVLELDFTFYRPLIEADGQPGTSHHVVERYCEHAPASALFLVKAPQMFCQPTLPGRGPNADYLNRALYDKVFGDPLSSLLGDRLLGVIFEQGYISRKETPGVADFVETLDRFAGSRRFPHAMHFEIRSTHFLEPLFFDWLNSTGHGYVFSHWTWLPSIKDQWRRAGAFSSADGEAVLRLLTPRKMTYAKAYDLAHPFDKVIPALREAPGSEDMLQESVALAIKAVEAGKRLSVISNNRAWGNAPELALEVSQRLRAHLRNRKTRN